MRRERVAQRIWFLNKPLFAGIVPIRLKQVPGEILAGVTLAALAIPEVMGYTKIAGMPVITGLYTLLIPAALFAIFGSSRHLVVGADSATAAILASALIGMAAVGSDQYVALAMALSIMVGLILLVASVLGLGFMADFLSRTVLIGFLSGVGVQVALHAVIDLLGVKLHESLAGSLLALVSHEWSANTLAVALAALTVIILLAGKLFERRYKRRLPLAILVVIGAITLSWLFDFGAHMPVVGKVPTGFPTLEVPDVDLRFSLVWTLLPTALAMAVIVLAQSAATARAFANQYHETLDEERDLFGLGLANIGAGLSGTFVVNGSPTKTEMADEAGGRTQLTMLVTVVVVALTLLFLTAPLSYLPDAVLSAVVFLIGVGLIDVRGLTDVYDKRRAEFWIALSTAAIVVLFGVEKGIAFAVLLAVIGHTRHGYHPADLLLARDADGDWCGEPLSSRTQAEPGLLIYRFGHSMYFANAPRMRTEIQNLVRDNTVPV
ncbi:MAG: SulP family inorganic anion transporter, partial [Pseudomonadota bacterium]